MVAHTLNSKNGSPAKPAQADPAAARDTEAAERTELDCLLARERARHAALPGPAPRKPFKPYVLPPSPTAEEIKQRKIAAMLGSLNASLGQRYAGCTLDNFQVSCPQQAEVIARLRGLIPELASMAKEGRGLIFSGRCGTGKDHLAAAMLRLCATEHEIPAAAVNARILAGLPFDQADGLIAELTSGKHVGGDIFTPAPRVLLVSDPAPSTPFAVDRLMRLLEARYAKLLPTWLTLNSSSREEANAALGPAMFGRFSDGAEIFLCQWPDWRQRGNRAT